MKSSAPLADALHPPPQDVTDGRLPRLDSGVTRHDRAIDDTANAGDVTDVAVRRCNRAIAGGRADDLHQRPGANARPDRAVVRVEAAHGDRNAGAQAERIS